MYFYLDLLSQFYSRSQKMVGGLNSFGYNFSSEHWLIISEKFKMPKNSKIYELLTLCNSASDLDILLISMLNLSSSCSRTTVVGLISMPNFFLILSRSNSWGSLAWMSDAMLAMKSSRLMPDPDSPEKDKRDAQKLHNWRGDFLILLQTKKVKFCIKNSS